MKAVIYGAGNIGRGFIGQIFSRSGYELVFIDVSEIIVDALNREGRYPIRILSENKTEDIWIEKVQAINGRNQEEAAESIAEADIMATAVGVRSLPLIAPALASGFRKRGTALNIIVCENLIDADKELANYIKAHLTKEDRQLFDESVGLVEASVGRMVPLQTGEMQDGNPLRVCVEAYSFLPVNKAAFKGEIPSLVGLCAFDNFDFYIKRKLFVHNLGHAICAYFGMIKGNNYIYESGGSILFIAQNAMMESALALSAKYDVSLAALYYHIRELLRRFSNKALGDTCARVGGDTVRKLGNKDRFIGALFCCGEEGINPVYISAGAAAAFYCHLQERGITQSLQTARIALKEVSGLNENSAEAEMILSFYSMLASPKNGGFDEMISCIIKTASDMGQRPDII
jgi:mannitol-1-phosphate 5-dehydrogenase